MQINPEVQTEADDPLMTSGEVAELARVSVDTVGRWAMSGALATAVVTPGGHRRFRRSAVLAALDPKPAA